jgi:hypothetical protein
MKRIHILWAATFSICVVALAPLPRVAAHGTTALATPGPDFIECQYTNEYDNIQVNSLGNPTYDDLGNQWVVYYDITRDIHDNVPCDMRVVVRIFNPAPDGSWRGTVQVFADHNNVYDPSSYGKVSGSCTYQYHFVWRGPWFGGDFGSYHIEIDEFNGSNTYGRAITDFSL